MATSATYTASFGNSVAATSYADSVNPASPNYLKFKTNATTNTGATGCTTEPYAPTGTTAIR